MDKAGRPGRKSKVPAPYTLPDQGLTCTWHQATNLRSFANFLSSIRRAYLDLGSSTSSSTSTAAPPKRTLDPSKKGLAAWEGVRWLTDKERDEIDFAVKVALRKSVDRVRQLEQLEKGKPRRFRNSQ